MSSSTKTCMLDKKFVGMWFSELKPDVSVSGFMSFKIEMLVFPDYRVIYIFPPGGV